MKRQDNSGALCGNQCDERAADLKAEAAAHDESERQEDEKNANIFGHVISDTRGEKPHTLGPGDYCSIYHPRPVGIKKTAKGNGLDSLSP